MHGIGEEFNKLCIYIPRDSKKDCPLLKCLNIFSDKNIVAKGLSMEK